MHLQNGILFPGYGERDALVELKQYWQLDRGRTLPHRHWHSPQNKQTLLQGLSKRISSSFESEWAITLINWLLTPDIHDLHEHGVERASTFVQPRHPQQPHLQQTQVKHSKESTTSFSFFFLLHQHKTSLPYLLVYDFALPHNSDQNGTLHI